MSCIDDILSMSHLETQQVGREGVLVNRLQAAIAHRHAGFRFCMRRPRRRWRCRSSHAAAAAGECADADGCSRAAATAIGVAVRCVAKRRIFVQPLLCCLRSNTEDVSEQQVRRKLCLLVNDLWQTE